MRIIDLLGMSLSSLAKRKVRTVLTVLGVVIGVASIVVMVSLGLGLSKSTMDSLSEYASLTAIEVTQPYNAEGVKEADKKFLDEALIEELMQIDHVVGVDPVIDFNLNMEYGKYAAYIQVRATTLEAMEAMNIKVGDGRIPSAEADQLELFMGNQVLTNVYNKRTYASYWDTGELPDVDWMKDHIFYTFEDTVSDTGENGATRKPKKYQFPVCGVAEGGVDKWYSYSYRAYCDIDQAKALFNKDYKRKVAPGQPTTNKGKPYKELYYTTLYVNVDDMDNVAAVNQVISDMGYQTYNDAEWIAQQQQSLAMIEAVLGGIGAVSLLVAAIGIANTMMMSIYERTKEIGIMKVLGCDIRNIGMLFLMEAGFIGLIGGVVGLVISYILSAVINTLVAQSESMGVAQISYIPIWLALGSLVFAIMVGMLAGFFPSRRATQLSPLAAIQNN